MFFDSPQCNIGKISNAAKTACERPPWKTPIDCASKEYLHDTGTTDKETEWKCLPCPRGAYCKEDGTFGDIRALAGYWRVPWSEHNITFLRCPFAAGKRNNF